MTDHLHPGNLRERLRTESLGDANTLGAKYIARTLLKRFLKAGGRHKPLDGEIAAGYENLIMRSRRS